MAIRKFIMTEAQAAELRQAYAHTKDGPTRTRYQAVRLYGQGYSVPEIGDITGCSRTSLMDWSRLYRRHGVAGLVDHRLGGNRAKLSREQRATVNSSLHLYTPRQLFGPEAATPDGHFWTVPDLKRAVQQWFGVTWSSSASYYTLFAACGFSYQRAQKVFRSRAERDVAAFEELLKKTDRRRADGAGDGGAG
jgi:transposase